MRADGTEGLNDIVEALHSLAMLCRNGELSPLPMDFDDYVDRIKKAIGSEVEPMRKALNEKGRSRGLRNVNLILSVVGSVAFCVGVHCISAALGLPREDVAHGALACLAIHALLSGR